MSPFPLVRLTAHPQIRVHPAAKPRMDGLLAHAPGAKVTSGYRTVARNHQIGGAKRSRHLLGLAIDIVGTPGELAKLQAQARAHGATEVLLETDHLHVAWPRHLAGAST